VGCDVDVAHKWGQCGRIVRFIGSAAKIVVVVLVVLVSLECF
jgi:hypothetical protein